MADEPKQNWLHTLPGILTATGTLLGAVTALLLALNQIGLLGGGNNSVHAQSEAPAVAAPPPVAEMPMAAKATSTPPPKPGACSACPEMVNIPAGSFLMGSPKDEAGRGDNEDDGKGNQVRVTIDKPFAAGKFEVTFAQWDACVAGGGCKSNPVPPDNGWGRGQRPVVNISFEDAQELLAWLNKNQDPAKPYRLPTEAEWEYAARGGAQTAYPWGKEASHEFANYGAETCCSGAASGKDRWKEETAPVGQFPANAFGLHDMHGNVWEWVTDCYDETYESAPANGEARQEDDADCEERAVRGGAWDGEPTSMRSADRFGEAPTTRNEAIGFRVARDL